MRRLNWIIGATLCLASGVVRAATTYSYVGIVQGNGSLTNGGSNTVNLYLAELSDAGGFTAPLDGGLAAAGVALVARTGASGVTFTSVSANVGNEPAAFSGSSVAHPLMSGDGAWIEDVAGAKGGQGVMPTSSTTDANGVTYNLYLLGSVTLNLASNASANFAVESLYDVPKNDGVFGAGASDGHTVTFKSASQTGYDLDGSNSARPLPPGVTAANAGDANPSFLSTPVPEPASCAVFGLGAAGLLARRRRRAD